MASAVPAMRDAHWKSETIPAPHTNPLRVPHGPCIPVLTSQQDRPFFSVMIPTFNSTRFLRQTLESVLAQDPGPEIMEIVVVDNASTDDPEAVVREVGGNRVRFVRQLENIGAIKNFNSCIARARGHWIHILHSDD